MSCGRAKAPNPEKTGYSNNTNLKIESIFLSGANRIGLAAAGEIEDAQADVYSYVFF